MYVVCVTIKVKPAHIQDFIQAIKLNHEGTRKEPGNLRFDVLQSEENPAHFFLYEVYKTKDDFPKHRETDHFKKWRDTVESLMEEPRVGLRYVNLFPTDENWQ